MSDSSHDGKNLLDRSLELLRGVSRRVQREAGRSWQVSGLKAEVHALRGQRADALRRLGIEAHRRLSANAPAGQAVAGLTGLDPLSREIGLLSEKITGKEAEIFRLERAAIGRPETAGPRPQKESRRLLSGASRPRISLSAVPPVTGDPLEDILGKVSDADLVEIEEAF